MTISHSHRGIPKLLDDMKSWYDIKVRGILGGGSSDDEEVTILGRRLRWRKGTKIIEYEADDKYVKEVVKEMNLQEDSEGLDAPVERQIVENGGVEDVDLLDVEEAKRYRVNGSHPEWGRVLCPYQRCR